MALSTVRAHATLVDVIFGMAGRTGLRGCLQSRDRSGLAVAFGAVYARMLAGQWEYGLLVVKI